MPLKITVEPELMGPLNNDLCTMYRSLLLNRIIWFYLWYSHSTIIVHDEKCSSNRITKKSVASVPVNSNRIPTVTYNESMTNKISATHFTRDFISGPINSGSTCMGTLQLRFSPVYLLPIISGFTVP